MVNLILLLTLSLDKLFQDTERFSNLTASMTELPTVTKLFNIFCKLHRRYVILNSHKYVISKTFLFFFAFKKYCRLKPLSFHFSSLFLLGIPSPPPPTKKKQKKHKKKKFRDVYEFSMEKSGTEKRENKINIKNQCLLQSYIYNDNKDICKFK